MKLNYLQKENGMYILSKNAIEDIATSLLNTYYPQNLRSPLPLNTTELLEDCFGLTVKRKYIGTFGSGILGLIVMNDEVEIPSYDDMYRPTVLRETYGTVLISPHLAGYANAPRRGYTEAHEGAHFILHGEYYRHISDSAAGRSGDLPEYIACRKVEMYRNRPQGDFDWMEWQADSLAAALLMPKDVFRTFAEKVIRDHGISGGCISGSAYTGRGTAFEIISQVAEKFKVSFRATQIRMLHFGLIAENAG